MVKAIAFVVEGIAILSYFGGYEAFALLLCLIGFGGLAVFANEMSKAGK